jgi:isoquinoline 1-oxidoreductase alpha subunit
MSDRIAKISHQVRKQETRMPITIRVNGVTHTLDVEPEMPLLWVLRDEIGLTGTKFGCGAGACGACTVHMDGQAMHSCSLPVSSAEGKDIVTIEGLAGAQATAGTVLAPIQAAWIAHQVPQCGYCQSGMLMAVSALLAANPKPSDEEIDRTITNICRCGSYPRVRAAIHSVSNA